MKFTKKQQDYLKHCGEHFEVLIGGRGHSKTKEIIEDMQNEIDRLNNIINELEKYWKEQQEHYRYYKDNRYRTFLSKNLDKLKELKEVNNEL